MKQALRISGKARQVFSLLSLLASERGNLTIGEITKKASEDSEISDNIRDYWKHLGHED